MSYIPMSSRYDTMKYNRSGNCGIKLPALSLGLWYNFGGINAFENSRAIIRRAFDLGITYFDLANNYGPPYGSAEETFGKVLKKDLRAYRDELFISTKAGYDMWPGPYGDGGSRKYLLSSLDQSLKRIGLEYVDIFYSHRFDPETPLEETMSALDTAVRQGKALYAGLSVYRGKETLEAIKILKQLGTPCITHMRPYSMFFREAEDHWLHDLEELGIGGIAFCPLAQGLLTDKYLHEIPSDSRVASPVAQYIDETKITKDYLVKIHRLNEIAKGRGQTLAQMALAWILRHKSIASAVIGVSKLCQLEENVKALDNLQFSEEELSLIDGILA